MKTLKVIAMFAVAVAAWSASAEVDSYLYWMVGDPVKYDFNGADIDYSYAKVSTDGGETYLTLYGTGGSLDTDILDKGETGYAGFASTPGFSSFLFELYNDDDEKVGWTTLSYSQAAQYVYSNPTSPSAAGVFGITQAAPEPSSGILLLVGLAGLALRRRRVLKSEV